jgi:hypothetical protein
MATKLRGPSFVLKECEILNHLQRNLFEHGIETVYPTTTQTTEETIATFLKPSMSAVSLTSLVSDDTALIEDSTTVVNSVNTDSKRGKAIPPNVREGCLLILRALCEIVGTRVEPYVVGAFLTAALDECASSNSAVREAAEDAAVAISELANPYAFTSILYPILVHALQSSSEWRVKATALERIGKLAEKHPNIIRRSIPKLIPILTPQVWDTKLQVSKAARSALTSVVSTNPNADIRPTIPALINAICKPSETNKAVSELMGTTFVVPVDASTLAILCPVLSRALKEKLAIHKRAACIVISNMSKLVETPQAVAPFGDLLVPELQKVAANVQFEEIRDEALKALNSLTKALGDQYRATTGESSEVMEAEQDRVVAEQERIRIEREEEARKFQETKDKEDAERRQFKEAMEAQRRLEEMAKQEASAKKAEETQRREMQKLSTKAATGKCQGCGLKKCKPDCMFKAGK